MTAPPPTGPGERETFEAMGRAFDALKFDPVNPDAEAFVYMDGVYYTYDKLRDGFYRRPVEKEEPDGEC